MELPSCPFWDFSLEIYAKPGVSQACLALQDERRIDVNLLLFCCWAGPLDEASMRRAVDAVAQWQTEVVRPLRAVRRRLKANFGHVPHERRETLRQEIKTSELGAEFIEQLLLTESLETAQPAGNTVQHAAANLANYFAVTGALCGANESRHLASILAACFPQLEQTAIDRALASAAAAILPYSGAGSRDCSA